MELAKTQLEKFQESARGDLEKRQTAIDELVKPVKESLGKVDAKLQEIELGGAGLGLGRIHPDHDETALAIRPDVAVEPTVEGLRAGR